MPLAKKTLVGAFVLAGLLCVAYLTIKLGRMEVFDAKGFPISARFTSVAGLRVGANVEIAGVTVGRVVSIHLNKEAYVAVVDMRLTDQPPLYDGTMASIKTSGLIGDKYIELSPGGGDATLAEGAVITDTQPSLDIESLISKFVTGGI